MTSGLTTVVCPVTDVARAKALYTRLLGAEPAMDQPYYVGFRVGGTELGLDPNGHRHGPTPYWEVDDISGRLGALLDAGATEVEAIHDVGGGKLIAVVKDADGNIIGLSQSPS